MLKKLVFTHFLMLFFAWASFGSVGKAHKAFISPFLQQQFDSEKSLNSVYRVNIVLKAQYNIDSLSLALDLQKASPDYRAKTVVRELMQWASRTQGSVEAKLYEMQRTDPNAVRLVVPLWISNVFVVEATQKALLQIGTHPDVLEIRVDLDPYLVPDIDTSFRVEGTQSVGGTEVGLRAIKADKIWARGYTGRNRKVMSIDTGFQPHHPALRRAYLGNYMPQKQCWTQTSTNPYDCNGPNTFHGSHTSGTMVGLDTLTKDTIGVAFNAKLIGANGICSGGPGTLQALQWALNPDGDTSTTSDLPDAINNSWGGTANVSECTGTYVPVLNALEAAGVAVVFSAGNSGPGASTVTSPKNINTSLVSVFCVGNLNAANASLPINSSSSRGPSICTNSDSALLIKPEVSAPGTNVRSVGAGVGYQNLTGTSMASPHACGSVALLKEAFPGLTGTQIKLALYYTATDLGTPGEDNVYGRGIINLDSAFQYLAAQFTPTPPPSKSYDLQIGQIFSPQPYACSEQITPIVQVRNTGDSTIQQYTAQMILGNGTVLQIPVSRPLLPGASDTVSLPSYTFPSRTSGVQTAIFRVSTSGISELDTFNNRRVYRWNYSNVDSLPYQNSFTGGFGNIRIHNADSLTTWSTATTSGATGTAASINLRGYSTRNSRDFLYLPQFTPTQSTQYHLTFKVAYRNFTTSRNDSLIIRLLPNCGGIPITLYAKSNTSLATGPAISTSFTPSSTEWRTDTVSLSNYLNLGQSFSLYFEVFNDNGNNLFIDDIRISQLNAPPVASFIYNPLPGCLPITVNFTNTSFNADSVVYDFGTLGSSNQNNPTQTFTSAGNYSVKLIAINNFGRDTLISNVTITPDPLPDFVASDTLIVIGVGNQSINFTNLSQNATQYNWIFGDGSTSNSVSPSKTYNLPGIYTVSLQAASPNCMKTSTKTDYIRVMYATSTSTLKAESVRVYPNPFEDYLILESEMNIQKLEILDAGGRKVWEQIKPNTKIQIPSLSKGLYWIRLFSQEGGLQTLKLAH